MKLALASRRKGDNACAGIIFDDEREEYATVDVVHLRALIRAAGLWTAEMEYRPLKAADDEAAGADDQMRDATASPVALSAEPEAAAAPPPPAEGGDIPTKPAADDDLPF